MVSTLSGVVADLLIERRVFSVTVVRKLFTLTGKETFFKLFVEVKYTAGCICAAKQCEYVVCYALMFKEKLIHYRLNPSNYITSHTAQVLSNAALIWCCN